MTLDEIRRRPTLPGRFQPSTISVLRLNFCVRDGNRWIPFAIATGNRIVSRAEAMPFSTLSCPRKIFPPLLWTSGKPSAFSASWLSAPQVPTSRGLSFRCVLRFLLFLTRARLRSLTTAQVFFRLLSNHSLPLSLSLPLPLSFVSCEIKPSTY